MTYQKKFTETLRLKKPTPVGVIVRSMPLAQESMAREAKNPEPVVEYLHSEPGPDLRGSQSENLEPVALEPGDAEVMAEVYGPEDQRGYVGDKIYAGSEQKSETYFVLDDEDNTPEAA